MKENGKSANEAARDMLARMTPDERFDLVCGAGMGTRGFPRLGIPPVHFADASAGVRRCDPMSKRLKKTTSFPCPLLLAATWEPAAAREYARMIGEECRAAGIHFLLGPGMNMYRNARYGRNFEYFGEDPVLCSAIVEAYVTGLQSTGTSATIKHWIGNETDLKRCSSNTVMDERTLHEVYAQPFMAGIRSGARAVMTAYNQFNGEWCGQSAYLNQTVLREKLGFDGMIMTDWHSVYDGKSIAHCGVDLEMPDGLALSRERSDLQGSPAVDRMAMRILKTYFESGYMDPGYAKPALEQRIPKHLRIARRVNERGITLLKNNGILPLPSPPEDAKILITGNAATRISLAGGGSAFVIGYDNTTYLEAIRSLWGDGRVHHIENPSVEDIRSAACVIVFSAFGTDSDPEAEGHDHAFALPDDALIQRCTASNKNTIVAIATGCGVSMKWNNDAAAVLWLGLGGQTAPSVFCDILTGKVSPSGKLPFTIEKRFEDSPAFGYDKTPPDTSNPYRISSTVTKSKRVEFYTNSDETEFYTYNVRYTEAILIGYRWYDEKEIPVRYPFGHGLSYTEFSWSDLHVIRRNERVYLSFTLENTGKCPGGEVAQVYIRNPMGGIKRPLKELKAFVRVYLGVGQAKRVKMRVPFEALRYWDTDASAWRAQPGEYVFCVGDSSATPRLERKVCVSV